MVVFPIVAALITLGCAIAVGRDYVARPKPDKMMWTIAFAMFATAAGAEAFGALVGWTPLLARVYYVLGATLVVGYLALGELYLILPNRRAWVDRVAGGLVALTALAVALVSRAAVGDVGSMGWQALQRGPGLTALTIGINSTGTLVLLGGLLYSAWRFRRLGTQRNRMLGCLLIAVGTLVVASGGTLTRFGSRQLLYIAMAIGAALIFGGYLKAKQPDVQRTASPVSDAMVEDVGAEPVMDVMPVGTVSSSGATVAALQSSNDRVPASVNVVFACVGSAGELIVPSLALREAGLRAGELVALVVTDDGLLVASRATFSEQLLDRIDAQLTSHAPANPARDADAPSVARLAREGNRRTS